MPQNRRKHVLRWYHCYLQHPLGDKIALTLTTVCRWSGIFNQARKIYITYKDCQKFKKRNAKYGSIPAKDTETLTPWHTLCVDLIGTYTILAKVRHPDNKTLTKELQLLCTTFIEPAMRWFEIAEVPIIDQSSAEISQIFN